ncbi:MAG: sigma-70 family RNA polymerase sigma factor [Planctomycetota bacterium]
MSESPKTRASLILRLRRPGDEVAWAEFVEIYQPLIFRLAQSKGLQEADALDLTQEVMARVAKAIDRFDPNPDRGSFRGWISRITRNLVIEFLRSKHRRQITADDSSIQQLIESVPSPSDSQWFNFEYKRQLLFWAAEKIKDSFQETTWQAFWLSSVDQIDIDSVAKTLNLSKGAVYIARSRVMAKLKKKIEGQLDHPTSLQPGELS